MQSCSVHHCVLFLLTLTFTTDPGLATVFPMYAKLHQPVTLPCEAQCSSQKPKWKLTDNRDVVFAECDQTSCRSKDGYEMSHDRYLKGDLSLTITNPDYSMRKTYTCECDYSDYVTVRLRISTVFSAVQMSPGEELKLDLSVPESVEVIYRGSVSADGVQICTVTNGTLQCKYKYTPRTSLSHSELTLRDVKPSDSGSYTIRDMENSEDICVYTISVSAVSSAVQMRPGEDLKLDLSVPESVEVIYRGSDSADGVQICTVTNRTLECNTEYTPRTSLSNSELTLRDVQRSESGTYTIRDTENNRDIRVYAVSVSGLTSGETAGIVIPVLFLVLLIAGVVIYRWRKAEKEKEEAERKLRQIINDSKAVEELIKEARHKRPEELEVLWKQVEEKINDLEEKYRDDTTGHAKFICKNKKEQLNLNKLVYAAPKTYQTLVGTMEKTVKIFEELKREETSTMRFTSSEVLNEMFTRVDEYLKYINFWCSENKIYLENIKNLSDEIKVFMKMVNMESHVHWVQQWYEEKMMELNRYREVLPAQAPNAPRNTNGEELVPFV